MKNYFENHLLWWAGIFFALGASACFAAGKFLYIDPRERDIAILQRQLETLKSEFPSIALQQENTLQKTVANRDKWITHSTAIESQLANCNSNIRLISEIDQLNQRKRGADSWVDVLLLSSTNNGTEQTKINFLRADEYRRQATQFQEQILGLQAKLARQ